MAIAQRAAEQPALHAVVVTGHTHPTLPPTPLPETAGSAGVAAAGPVAVENRAGRELAHRWFIRPPKYGLLRRFAKT